MKSYETFYIEVEEVIADISVLTNVLNLYYKTLLYHQNGNGLDECGKFCDWMYIINRYANEVQGKMNEIMRRNMTDYKNSSQGKAAKATQK